MTSLLKKLPKVFFILLSASISVYTLFSIKVTKAITKDDYKITKLLNIDKECSNLNDY